MEKSQSSFEKQILKKIIPPEKIRKVIALQKEKNKTVASLNGSFDLLHSGHLQIIYEASQQADILVVALNSDASIKKYKAGDRPIVPLKERLEMIASLEFVDFATWFEEQNPVSIIKKIRPNVHINGAEYGENCIEASILKQMQSRLHLFERIPSFSTSDLIAKVKKCD